MRIIAKGFFLYLEQVRWNSCYSYFDVLEGQIKWSLSRIIMIDEFHLMMILNTLENSPNRCKQQQNSCSMKGIVSTHKHVQLLILKNHIW